MQEKLVSRAKELLSDGTVVRVLGWRKGDTDFSAEPAFFESAESLDEFTYDGFCGANLSKYMIKASKEEGKTLVFLKPCDTYSFNQLIKEHRVDREKTYIVGIGCDGKLDIEKIREAGVVGMGGAGFPTHVKLSPKEPEKIDYIIANCAECEPYITADYRRMLENTEELVSGMRVVLSLFENAKGIFGVEDNKKDCIEKLQEAVKDEPRMEVRINAASRCRMYCR